MNHIHMIGIVLILTATSSGCTTTSILGTYVHEDKPFECLVLESGREYTVHKPVDTFGGSYRVIDGDLYLLIPDGSHKLHRDGNAYVDADGDRWIKK